MTNKQALQSLTEYENDNLLEKLLTDRGLTTSGDYVAANEEDIDLAAASLYFTLAVHPEFKDGSSMIKYSGVQLVARAKRILRKYDVDEATINGLALW